LKLAEKDGDVDAVVDVDVVAVLDVSAIIQKAVT